MEGPPSTPSAPETISQPASDTTQPPSQDLVTETTLDPVASAVHDLADALDAVTETPALVLSTVVSDHTWSVSRDLQQQVATLLTDHRDFVVGHDFERDPDPETVQRLLKANPVVSYEVTKMVWQLLRKRDGAPEIFDIEIHVEDRGVETVVVRGFSFEINGVQS